MKWINSREKKELVGCPPVWVCLVLLSWSASECGFLEGEYSVRDTHTNHRHLHCQVTLFPFLALSLGSESLSPACLPVREKELRFTFSVQVPICSSTICWKNSLFPHWIITAPFSKNQLTTYMWVFFWTLCHVPLIHTPVLKPVPHCRGSIVRG